MVGRQNLGEAKVLTDFNDNLLGYEIENITRKWIHVCGKIMCEYCEQIKNTGVHMNADIDVSGQLGEERGSPDEYIDTYKGDYKTRKR